MLMPRSTEMPVMNGSARVVLASCTRLTQFGREGIAWGTADEKEEVKVAGFAPAVTPLTPGNYGGTTIIDEGTRAWTWRKLLNCGRL